ncbi:hypothetical protein GCM10028817_09120 [Spirosoma pomorum]
MPGGASVTFGLIVVILSGFTVMATEPTTVPVKFLIFDWSITRLETGRIVTKPSVVTFLVVFSPGESMSKDLVPVPLNLT